MEDIEISGAGTLKTGEYGKVEISGSCTASGDIKCSKLDVSGTLHGSANIHCSGEADFSGGSSCGTLTADSIDVSGAFKADDVLGGTVDTAGSFKVKNTLKCRTLSTAGMVSAASVEADDVDIEGQADISGLLNAGKIQISGGKCSIGSIGCSEITVRSGNHSGVELLFGLIKIKTGGELITDSIEGDRIDLENTRCNIVRGAAVVIGKNCEIQEVEYTDSCTVDEASTVGKITKV